MSEDIYIETTDLKKYRTEIPNIIFDIRLHPLSLAIYCYIKRRAGAKTHGACTEGSANAAKNLGMVRTTYLKYRDLLTLPQKELNGKSLIQMEDLYHKDGGDKPKRITIIDIWPENFETLARSSVGGGVQEMDRGVSMRCTGGVQEMYTKKEPFKKEPKEELTSQLAEASRRPATFLYCLIKEINPKAKKPNLDQWAKDIGKLISIDGRTEDEIMKVIQWTFNDDFWCKNILSGSKLREKFDQLYINMVKHKESPKKKEEDAAKKKVDRCKANTQWAKEFLKDKSFPDHLNSLSLKDNGVVAIHAGNYHIIGFLEHGFQDQLTGIYNKIAS